MAKSNLVTKAELAGMSCKLLFEKGSEPKPGSKFVKAVKAGFPKELATKQRKKNELDGLPKLAWFTKNGKTSVWSQKNEVVLQSTDQKLNWEKFYKLLEIVLSACRLTAKNARICAIQLTITNDYQFDAWNSEGINNFAQCFPIISNQLTSEAQEKYNVVFGSQLHLVFADSPGNSVSLDFAFPSNNKRDHASKATLSISCECYCGDAELSEAPRLLQDCKKEVDSFFELAVNQKVQESPNGKSPVATKKKSPKASKTK